MNKPPKKDRKFLRQCASCRNYFEKEDLIRLTRDYKTGGTIVNNDNRAQGRSLYLCRNSLCIEKLLKNKKMIKSLPPEIIEYLKNL